MSEPKLDSKLRATIEHLVSMVDRAGCSLYYQDGISDAWEEVNELLAEIPLIEAARNYSYMWEQRGRFADLFDEVALDAAMGRGE